MKTLMEKLGVTPERSVALLGVTDHEFATELRSIVPGVVEGDVPDGTDIVFLQVEGATELGLIEPLVPSIRPDGAIWVLWPKGRLRLRQGDVMDAGKAAGLVDVKVVGFSEAFSALKFVIPMTRR